MGDNKQSRHDGHQPLQKKGYQPTHGKVTGGHQPATGQQKPSTPQPPPKKP